ncbi:glycerophosphodiester phosphodiesterase [Sporosarcina sp. ANT_H38]|uniref:glycerophosphodiester phosphodiesterase n=1 Tax=Sporosarcina sp. ANT_H38 TaxID=2597358 RepID=UPI0011F0DD10|nr:glycerophosphodiester phosphodiesterase [Sporosarcina sp. ANT_H38]KAA0964930.1 glycerophosphodiester phosphodiesterase [Sporosarcina sp. ANT_H38]
MNIYAHRGSSGTHPENTLAAFREAARLPIYGVEFDVHLTKDGELVVIHDETIARTSDSTGFVKDMTLAELKAFDFGSWFSDEFQDETIPLLQEVLEIFSETSHHLNIELKSDIFPYEGMAEKAVAMVQKMKLDARTVISSFDHEAVQTVKKIAPNIETAALFMEVLVDPLNYLRNIPADALHISLPSAVRPSMRNVVEDGVAVRVFTVNEEKYVETLNKVGITGIFTDYPEKMMIYLNRKS